MAQGKASYCDDRIWPTLVVYQGRRKIVMTVENTFRQIDGGILVEGHRIDDDVEGLGKYCAYACVPMNDLNKGEHYASR